MADNFDPRGDLNSNPKSVNEDQSTAQVMPSPIRRGSAQQSSRKGTLSVINTDFGGDCDDQKAISQHIADLGPDDQSFFVVSGPHPQRASEAIAQAYYAKTGKYPVVALGRQFEAQKVPEEKIFSLINSRPMHTQKLDGFEPVTLEVLQTKIDDAIKQGNVARLEQCAFGPLHKDEEYYNPSSRLASDPTLKEIWEALPKTAVVQFQRAPDDSGGFKYSGNNFQKSKPGVAENFNAMLAEQGYTRTYFEGAVAKSPDFLLSVRQERLPGIEKAASTYMENLQVPWASMPGKSGTTPEPGQMHVAMFTPKGEVPFGVHVAGAIPPGFGIERLSKEVCGVSPGTEDFTKLTAKIHQELDRFDGQVLRQLQTQYPDLADTNVPTMRANMHGGMMGALQEFAENKGMQSASFTNFKQFFAAAKEQGVKLNAFTYMDEFKEILFQKNSMVRDITAIAQEEAHFPGPDGKSHLDTMTSILSGYGARAVMYDAVTLAAAHTVEKNPDLAAYFTETDGARNVSQAKVANLRDSNSGLYRELSSGIRTELTRDGGALATREWQRDSAVPAREPTITAVSKLGPARNFDRATEQNTEAQDTPAKAQSADQKRSATVAGLADQHDGGGPEHGDKHRTNRSVEETGKSTSAGGQETASMALKKPKYDERDRDRSPVR